MANNNPALDSGLIQICNLTNTAAAGGKPAFKLAPVFQCYFGERSISYSRQYLAMGANQHIDFVARILNLGTRPKIGQYAILGYYDGQENENGDQFRIDNVQAIFDDDGLKVFDLTLSRLGEFYEVIE